jgi:AcrR family transcriptional regulator
MGSAERRERERSEVRTRILDAARELFAEEGYEAVTMRRVAEKIEYSATAIYFHFRDKLALVRALVAADFLSLAARFQTIAKVADPLERMRLACRAYVDFAIAHPNHYRLMFMTSLPPIPLEEREHDRGVPERDSYAFLKGVVNDGLEAGLFRPEFRDPDLIAQLLWAGVHGVAALAIAKADAEWVKLLPAKKLAREMCEVLINGLVVPEPRRRR